MARSFDIHATACGLLLLLLLQPLAAGPPQAPTAAKPVDEILRSYVAAVGGQAALDKITTREVEITHRLAGKEKLFWMAPDHVLWTANRERQAFDGNGGWYATKRKRIKRLERARGLELEIDANPLRFTRLHSLYRELNPAPPELLNGQRVDIVVAPNDIGASKFYFETKTHLLIRLDEFGTSSAYFHHITDFSHYEEIDGVRLPLILSKQTDEPGAETGEIRLAHVQQNLPLDAGMFRKPDLGGVLTGGKH